MEDIETQSHKSPDLESGGCGQVPSRKSMVFDYCIAFKNYKKAMNTITDEEAKAEITTLIHKRKVMTQRLKKVGLIIQKRKGSDGKMRFLLITATQEKLDSVAEIMGLELTMKQEFGGGSQDFTVGSKELFQPFSEKSFYSKTDRQRIIHYIIESPPDMGGADVDVEKMERKDIIAKCFPLHHQRKRKELLKSWVRNFWKPQPIQDIRSYFGEEVAFYFSWLGYYTTWLAMASFFGFIAYIVSKSVENDHEWSNAAYSVFLAFWATLFLEIWGRKQNYHVFEWNMQNFVDQERARPEYEGEQKLGVYRDGLWIPLKEEETYGVLAPKRVVFYPRWKTVVKIGVSMCSVVFLICVVLIATISILSFRLFMQNEVGESVGGGVGAVANACTILFLNYLYRYIAEILTKWENHRTDTEYTRKLTIKIFLFQFVNSYTSLFYIAYFKSGTRLWGSDALLDECNVGDGTGASNSLWSGCTDELALQLGTILITNLVIGQAKEFLIPWFKSQYGMFKNFQRVAKKNAPDEPVKWYQRPINYTFDLVKFIKLRKRGSDNVKLVYYERESKLAKFEGVFDEYSEMVIQFGYITLFAASFPLASLIALLNNVIEIRSDAGKLLLSTNKPHYQGAQDIGSWNKILYVLSVVAVVNNCLLIGFTYPPIIDWVEDRYLVLWIVVILEHLVLLIKFAISYAIPNMPAKVKKLIAKQDYIREETMKRLAGRTAAELQDDEEDEDSVEEDEEDDNQQDLGWESDEGELE